MVYERGDTRASPTDRDEEAARAVVAREPIRGEELEPGVVAVEDELARLTLPCTTTITSIISRDALRAYLREPRVLQRKARASIALCKVKYEIEERGHGACGQRFDARHSHSRRSRVGGEGYGCA